MKQRHIKSQGEVIRSSTPKIGFHRIAEPTIEIMAWCPDEEAKAPPEQVHFVQHVPGLQTPLVLRFKSPDTLGFFIEELIQYRRVVWPQSEKVTGENC
jgi:hypothetical protein